MRINSIKGTLNIKCRAVIFSITATGGKNLKQPIQLLKKVQEIYGLSGIN
jgi:hypothetical protein